MERDREALYTRIEGLVTTGKLPCEDCVVAWYGPGRGRHCEACGLRVPGTDTEIECDVPGGGTIHFHLACYDTWQSVLAAKD